MVRGLLEVHVLSANGLVDKQWVGKQDPYCKLQLGNQSYRTTTASDGGTKPVWNERFQFQVGPQHRELVAAVWNSNSLRQNDCLGSVRIPLVKVLNDGHDNTPQPIISTKGKSAGELRLAMMFTAEQAQQPQAPPQQAPVAQPQAEAARPQQVRVAVPQAQAVAPRAPAPAPVYQQPVQQQVYRPAVQQVAYAQPAPVVVQQPRVVVQQPQVVYAQPQAQVVYTQPQVAQYYPAAPANTFYRYQ